jgi:hypothetical protein
VHEIAHRFFCDIAGVPVYEVCYIRLGNPAGYVVHGNTTNLRQSFLISVGPFIINTHLFAIVAFPASIPMWMLDDGPHTNYFLLWLGISIGMHAFPSKHDLDNFQKQVKAANSKKPLVFFAAWVAAMFSGARILSFFWFDAIYAIAISMIVPLLIVGAG